MMDWLNTGFYRDFGYGLVYPQIFPHHHRRSDEANAGAIDRITSYNVCYTKLLRSTRSSTS